MTDVICATAINKVYPDGMKTIAYSLKLSGEIEPEAMKEYAFEVWDQSYEPFIPAIKRKVTKTYISDKKTIIIETDINEKAAYAIGNYEMDGRFNPFGPGNLGFEDPDHPKKMPLPDTKDVVKGPGKNFGYIGPKPLKSEIKIIKGTEREQSVYCDKWCCPELNRFQIEEYDGQRYLLYIPENYNPEEKYPLILFIVDASARGTYERNPLIQGDGALIWTEEQNQKKHPCFVVAPIYEPEDILTHDDFTFDSKLYKAKEITDVLQQKYSIDKKRIYTTGQSMGCMGSCQLMIRWPEYFAGALLVAGQWDPKGCCKAMKGKRIWIFVSENDRKAYPGMKAVTDELEKNGEKVDHFTWDAKLPHPLLEKEAQKAGATEAKIKYTVFKGSSVVPEGIKETPGSNHTCTWQVAYDIDAVREWLLDKEV